MSSEPLRRARRLLEAMDERREERIADGNVGEWQTELNEVRRILHAILEHLEPPRRYDVEEPDDTPY